MKGIIREAYFPLLKKYHDEEENPANKTIEAIQFDLKRNNSDAYLLMLDEKPIGYVQKGILQEVNEEMHFVLYVRETPIC